MLSALEAPMSTDPTPTMEEVQKNILAKLHEAELDSAIYDLRLLWRAYVVTKRLERKGPNHGST